MRYRWLAVCALAATLAIGGCAPAQTGASGSPQASADAEDRTDSGGAAPSMAGESPAGTESENSAPDDYDY